MQGRYWADLDEVAAFEELVGSHGGLGGGQAHPFVLFPAALPWPEQAPLGAGAVHRVFRGWLAGLGHASYAENASPGASTTTFVEGASAAT